MKLHEFFRKIENLPYDENLEQALLCVKVMSGEYDEEKVCDISCWSDDFFTAIQNFKENFYSWLDREVIYFELEGVKLSIYVRLERDDEECSCTNRI